MVTSESALTKSSDGWLCNRCGNKKAQFFYQHFCSKCNSKCTYCRHCIQMGKASSCVNLYSWNGSPINYSPKSRSCEWLGTLSPAQQKAADTLVSTITIPSATHLIWAVCGAGKTEILFPVIEKCIRFSKRVAIATPRTDVVKELAPRLKTAFPSITQSVLYGGSRNQVVQAQLVLATTHQLLRYSHTFDLLIVDEVDAFPYSYDPSLKFAVHNAIKNSGVLIFLSATPSKTLLHEKNLKLSKIPIRFHGKPLPLPRFKWVGNWQKALNGGEIPNLLLKWLSHFNDEPKMIFLPSIYLLNKLSKLLKNESYTFAAVHAKAPHRHQSIAAFRDGRLRLLLTTTILERGVTVENLQVAVLGAENPLFSEACLVQISGRVGRKPSFPSGDIVFWHNGVTAAMNRARKHLKNMNKEAGL